MGESSETVIDVISNYLSDIIREADGTYSKDSAWNGYAGNGEIDRTRVEELSRQARLLPLEALTMP
jgi:hypothetical protein